MQTLEDHSGAVTSVVFSNDLTRLASASVDSTVKIWDASNGDCLQTLKDHHIDNLSMFFCNTIMVGACQKTPSSSNDLFMEALLSIKTNLG